MKIPIVTFLLFFFWATLLNAQLKEFEISEMPRPDVSIVQANTEFPDDALIIVYSSLDNLSFRSSVGAVDRQFYNARANRYEILVKSLKQMIFISASEFMEQKLATINPKPKEDYYFKVEEKKTALNNQTALGKLTINSIPAGAKISLNSISITNKTPFTGELSPGPTRIQLSKAKYYTLDTMINIQSSINDVLTINLKPSNLWLNITSNPSGAKVEFDGKVMGATPLSKELDLTEKSEQGPRYLKISLLEYADQSQTIQVYPSKDPITINVDLKKTEGAFFIQSAPEGAEVFIDGVYKGITPMQGIMPVGKYSVELKMDDYAQSSIKQLIVNTQTIANLKENLILKKKAPENLGSEYEDEILKDASGQSYKTVKIGDQIWMAENLKTERYANGDLIPNVRGGSEWINLNTGAWCNYDNSIYNQYTYGKLYNWFAVADYRNICPIGWHVPTDAEWTVLIDYLGGEFVAGNKMKSIGLEYWNWKNPNENATNESGFSGLPGGLRIGDYDKFINVSANGFWWSSTESSVTSAWYRSLSYNDEGASRSYGDKQRGFSVRCLKD
jgi:uncharacterized protein (TIGR02145 family)